MKPFEHKFKNAFGIIDTQGISGYLQALKALYNHIAEVTEMNPEKRYIDAVDLLDRISATNAELKSLMEQAEKELKELTEKF